MSDKQIELGITSVTSNSTDFLTNFSGSNPRGETSWTYFNCLFENSAESFTFENSGVSATFDGIIYLSPEQLIPIYGTFRIDKLVTLVRLNNVVFQMESIRYLEELYDDCIAVELKLTDAIRG